ncbi:MAG: hypothetical protein ACFB0G_24815 [Leptolyngbyaceae cyanobacterium]
MNITALRQRPQWIVIGTVMAAAVVGGTLRIISSLDTAPPVAESAPAATVETEASAEVPELFNSPMLSLSAELRKAATPSELVPSTPTADRLSVVTAGRLDPFAPITPSIGATSSPKVEEAVPAANAGPPVAPSLPTTAISAAPNLPPVPYVNTAPPQLPLPAIPVAANPLSIPALPSFPQATPVPQSPIDAVELSGVVQVGDRIGVIVREGNGQSSRHIFEGDLLGGGQIRVKSIDLSAQEPLIILEYQGQEYTRMVG